MALLSQERRARDFEWGKLRLKYGAESCWEEPGQRARHAPPISHAFFSIRDSRHRTPCGLVERFSVHSPEDHLALWERGLHLSPCPQPVWISGSARMLQKQNAFGFIVPQAHGDFCLRPGWLVISQKSLHQLQTHTHARHLQSSTHLEFTLQQGPRERERRAQP